MNPKAVEKLQVKAVDGQVLVHDVEGDMVHVLNAGAGEVLALCDGSRDIDEIVRSFGEGKNVPDEDLRRDVLSIIDTFAQLRILKSD